MDSICKNIGGPYIGLFAERVRDLFRLVFDQSDGKIRASLARTLGTWPPIFPSQIVDELRGFVASRVSFLIAIHHILFSIMS